MDGLDPRARFFSGLEVLAVLLSILVGRIDVPDAHFEEFLGLVSQTRRGSFVRVDELAGLGVDDEHRVVGLIEEGSKQCEFSVSLLDPLDLGARECTSRHKHHEDERPDIQLVWRDVKEKEVEKPAVEKHGGVECGVDDPDESPEEEAKPHVSPPIADHTGFLVTGREVHLPDDTERERYRQQLETKPAQLDACSSSNYRLWSEPAWRSSPDYRPSAVFRFPRSNIENVVPDHARGTKTMLDASRVAFR